MFTLLEVRPSIQHSDSCIIRQRESGRCPGVAQSSKLTFPTNFETLYVYCTLKEWRRHEPQVCGRLILLPVLLAYQGEEGPVPELSGDLILPWH